MDRYAEEQDWDFAVAGAVAHLQDLERIARDGENWTAVAKVEFVLEHVHQLERACTVCGTAVLIDPVLWNGGLAHESCRDDAEYAAPEWNQPLAERIRTVADERGVE